MSPDKSKDGGLTHISPTKEGVLNASDLTPILPTVDQEAILAKFDRETEDLLHTLEEVLTLPELNEGLEFRSDIEEEKTRISDIKAQHAKTLSQLEEQNGAIDSKKQIGADVIKSYRQSVTKRKKIAVQAKIEREKAIIEYLDTLVTAYESMLIFVDNEYEYRTLYGRTAGEIKDKLASLNQDIKSLEENKRRAGHNKRDSAKHAIAKLTDITWLQSEQPKQEIETNNTAIDTLTHELEEKTAQLDAANTNLQTVSREFDDIKVSDEERKLNDARATITKLDAEIQKIQKDIATAAAAEDFDLVATKTQERTSKIAERDQVKGNLAGLIKQMLGKDEADRTDLSVLEAEFNDKYKEHLKSRTDLQSQIKTLTKDIKDLDERIKEINDEISKKRTRNINIKGYLNDASLIPGLQRDREVFLAEVATQTTIIDELEGRISTLNELKDKLNRLPVDNNERQRQADDFRTNTLKPSEEKVEDAIKLVREKRTLAENIDKEVKEIIQFSSGEARDEKLVRRLTEESRRITRAQLVATLDAATKNTEASQVILDELTKFKESMEIRNVRQNRLITALMVAALFLGVSNFFSGNNNNTSLISDDDTTEEAMDTDDDDSADPYKETIIEKGDDDTTEEEKKEEATPPAKKAAPAAAKKSTPKKPEPTPEVSNPWKGRL